MNIKKILQTNSFRVSQHPRPDIENVFILIFSVRDLESFIFADVLRRDIIEKKGKDVPIMFVGLRSAHAPDNAFDGSHGFSLFADVVFDFAEIIILNFLFRMRMF